MKRCLFFAMLIGFTVCVVSCRKKVTGDGDVDIVTDIDGNEYEIVTIGTQVWMAENLKVTHYRNGDEIPKITDDIAWSNLITGAYANYNNDFDNVDTYGRLYNWHAVNDSRHIAPEGWHVPTDEEWKVLESYLGMSQADADALDWRGTDEGGKLKEKGTSHWQSPNTGAENESGFSVLPGGYRSVIGSCYGMRYFAYFWSSLEIIEGHAWCRSLAHDHSEINRDTLNKKYGYSVRCVKD